MKWVGPVACVGMMTGVYRVSVVKPEGKRALRRPRPRWGDNIQMAFQEKGRGHRLD